MCKPTYIYVPMDVPFDFTFIRVESIWGNELPLDHDEPQPSYVHHQKLFNCPDVMPPGISLKQIQICSQDSSSTL